MNVNPYIKGSQDENLKMVALAQQYRARDL